MNAQLKSLSRLIALAALSFTPGLLSAQSAPAARNSDQPYASRWDIFAGYSYLAPKGTVQVPQAAGGTLPASYKAVNVGALFSGAYYFSRYLGGQVEFAEHQYGQSIPGSFTGTKGNNDGFFTLGLGPIVRFPTGNITPFVHGLVDLQRVNGPAHNPAKWGPGLTVGGGMDYELPWFNHRFAFRLFQADYEYMHVNFGPQAAPPGGRANINAARVSTGIVIHAGSIEPPPPVTLACTASPTSVFQGEPITLTASAGNLKPKENAVYSWTGSGVTGNGTSATVATTNLAPGSYTAQSNVKTGKSGKEGLKPWQSAGCSASFTVKEFEPPTISCSANPTTIQPNGTSIITCPGRSPQNRPLTYSYTASAGSVNGSGTTANYSAAGAPSGPVQITGTVRDDKGHSANASTAVNIVAPPPPPPPAPSPEQVRLEASLALHSIFFPTAQPNEAHPEAGLVESQQATLTKLATDFKSYLAIKPDARLTLTGHADERGSSEYNQALTDRRVNRAKQFLVEQGVPAASLDTRAVGKEVQLSADQVKALIQQNPDLSDADRTRVLRKLGTIVLAQNRRVDVTLISTGQQSVQLYPFNAADSLTLLNEKSTAPKKAAKAKQ